MTVKTIFGGWYSHSLLSGEYASLTAKGIETHLGLIPSPLNNEGNPDGPLFIDLTAVGGFHLAGKGANSYITHERLPDASWLKHQDAFGNYSVMYDLQGTLHIATGEIGSQGWRYVAPDGTLVTGDHSILLDGINEFTDLGDNILVGQGNATGGVVVRIDGVKRQFASGGCYDIKARRNGNDVTISFYLVAPDGLSAHMWWGTLDDLRALKEIEVPLPPPPTPPVITIPVISNVEYVKEVRPGSPWHVSADIDGTKVTVSIDAQQRLWLEATNSAGTGVTGSVRQLAILPALTPPSIPEPTPVPEPVPIPMRNARFWIAPSPAAPDLKAIFDDPSRLNNVGGFQFFVQEIMTDEPISQFAPHGYNYLKEVFPKLRALGIATGVEMGAVKVEDPQATSNTNTLEALFQRFEDAGGKVDFIAMDEPRTAGIKLGQDVAVTAACMAKFMARAKELRPDVKIIWIEAWPFVPFGDFSAIRNALPVQPDFIRLDVNWHDAEKDHKDPVTFLHSMDALGPVSVLVNSTVDPIATDAEHDANLVALAQKLHGILPNAPQVVVESWASRASGALQNVPNNLGEHGLLATFQKVIPIFEGTTPIPPPVPPSQEPIVVKSTVSEDPIVIKEVKSITGTKLSTLILRDDTVYSCQPGGKDGVRDAGSQGQYEKCRVEGPLATFKPEETKDIFYTKTFVETDGL